MKQSFVWQLGACALVIALVAGCGNKGKLKSPAQIEAQQEKERNKKSPPPEAPR